MGENYDRLKGGFQELSIAPYQDFSGDRATANWLIDQTFAEIWTEYINTGWIKL